MLSVIIGVIMLFWNVYRLGIAFEWGIFSWIGFIISAVVALWFVLIGLDDAMTNVEL